MSPQLAPQAIIEQQMRNIVQLGNYDAAYLFSDEGLPIATVSSIQDVDAERLAEMSILFQDVQRLANALGEIDDLKEMLLEGYKHRKIIFRFFPAFGEKVVLVAVIPPRKSYRKLTNELQRLIISIEL